MLVTEISYHLIIINGTILYKNLNGISVFSFQATLINKAINYFVFSPPQYIYIMYIYNMLRIAMKCL